MRFKSALLAVVAAVSLGLSLWLGARIIGVAMAAAGWLREAGPLGWLVFTGIEFLSTLVGIVPGALLGVAAGAVFGLAAGFGVSAMGIMAGALAAFWLSRSMLRPWIARALGGKARMALLDEAIGRDGWRLVALLRVSPVMPFSITSYALGFSAISARDYVAGTLASLPPLLGYVAIGALGGLAAAARCGATIHFVLLGLGVAATCMLVAHLSKLFGRVLRAQTL